MLAAVLGDTEPHVEALQRGNLALFVGGDLPREISGLLSRADWATPVLFIRAPDGVLFCQK
jgi:hypothetical protein